MKVLFLVPFFHSDTLAPYKRFTAGLAYTVGSIIQKFGEFGHDTYVFAQSAFSPGFEENKIQYLSKKVYHIFPLSFPYIKEFLNDTRGCKMPKKRYLHVFTYYLYGGYIERLLKKIKPDIVSIRGSGYYTKPYIMACERTDTKYIVSLHGIYSFDEHTVTTKREKQMEQELFKSAAMGGVPITVIASGIKKRMLNYLGIANGENIYVVSNGVDRKNVNNTRENINVLKEKYQIKNDDVVLISAASISERKNQLQILRSYLLLPENIRAHTKLLFLGSGELLETLKIKIQKANTSNVYAVGFVPNEEIGSYFSISHINVIASTDEGFGRAFVEGFLFGLPSVTFSDLDAISDLYSDNAMILVNERTDTAFAEGLKEAILRKWDQKTIKKHGEKFSTTNMAKKYERIYIEYLKEKKGEDIQDV